MAARVELKFVPETMLERTYLIELFLQCTMLITCLSERQSTTFIDADGIIGIGIAVTAAGLLAGGIAAALSSRKK